MTKHTRFVGVALLLAALPGAAPTRAAGCEFATRGEGQVLIVGLRGPAGLSLTVDWGDGLRSVSAPVAAEGGRTYVAHTYASEGRYAIDTRATGAQADCAMKMQIDVPYPGGDDPDTREILQDALGSEQGDTRDRRSSDQRDEPRRAVGVVWSIGCSVLRWIGRSSDC